MGVKKTHCNSEYPSLAIRQLTDPVFSGIGKRSIVCNDICWLPWVIVIVSLQVRLSLRNI
jgi:hypothetical protein